MDGFDTARDGLGAEEEKRGEFSPWGGKRAFQPWGGKRSSDRLDETERVVDDEDEEREVAKRQWKPRSSDDYIRALIKKGFQPWGGKRASFQPWGGKRSVAMDSEDGLLDKRTADAEDQDAGYKRGFQPWGGKRAFQPWGGKRTFDPWGGKRGFQPWGGKRAFNPWGGKRAFQPWGGKRSAEMLLDDIDQLSS